MIPSISWPQPALNFFRKITTLIIIIIIIIVFHKDGILCFSTEQPSALWLGLCSIQLVYLMWQIAIWFDSAIHTKNKQTKKENIWVIDPNYGFVRQFCLHLTSGKTTPRLVRSVTDLSSQTCVCVCVCVCVWDLWWTKCHSGQVYSPGVSVISCQCHPTNTPILSYSSGTDAR